MPKRTKKRSQISMDDNGLKIPNWRHFLEKTSELKEGVSAYRKADKEAKEKTQDRANTGTVRIVDLSSNKTEHQFKEFLQRWCQRVDQYQIIKRIKEKTGGSYAYSGINPGSPAATARQNQ